MFKRHLPATIRRYSNSTLAQNSATYFKFSSRASNNGTIFTWRNRVCVVQCSSWSRTPTRMSQMDKDEQIKEIEKLSVERCDEPAVIKLLSQHLTAPIDSRKQYDLVWEVLDKLVEVPLDKLPAFRPAVEHLAAADNLSVPKGENFGTYFQTGNAKYMLEFIDNPTKIWAPRVKIDSWAIRSLKDRVHTGAELRPVVPALLQWLADYNWPAYRPCYEQLARFPEATIEDIRALLPIRGDAELNVHVLEFVDREVPVGPLWQQLKPELNDLVELAASENSYERELAANATSMLKELQEWEAQQGKA